MARLWDCEALCSCLVCARVPAASLVKAVRGQAGIN